MKKFKHKKIKNTGLLFELLTRKLASEVLKNSTPKSLSLIQKYFKENTTLGKELSLYRLLLSEKVKDKEYANELISVVLEARRILNRETLDKEKYFLIKELKNLYSDDDIKSMFNTRLKTYSTLAAIYNLFENKKEDNPIEFLQNKTQIVEHVLKKSAKLEEGNNDYLTGKDKELRNLTFKFLVDKFNTKWNTLSADQTRVLKEYINNPTDSVYFKKFIKQEVDSIKKQIVSILKENKIKDKALVIKLSSITQYLDRIVEARYIKEDTILGLMRYYEIIHELKKH